MAPLPLAQSKIVGQGIGIGLIRGHGNEIDAVSVAAFGEVFTVFLKVLKISLPEMRGIDRVLLLSVFQAVEAGPLLERKIEFIGVPNLENQTSCLA